jgi:hypothetical protein
MPDIPSLEFSDPIFPYYIAALGILFLNAKRKDFFSIF